MIFLERMLAKILQKRVSVLYETWTLAKGNPEVEQQIRESLADIEETLDELEQVN